MARGETSRGGISIALAGERSSLRSSFRDTGAVRIGLSETAKVMRVADLVRDRAERHHLQHRELWVARHYTRLLLKSGPTLSLSPPGTTSDPKVALMRRARNEVAYAHATRLDKIDAAQKSLLNTGKIRATRTVDWGGKTVALADIKQGPENAKQSMPLRIAKHNVDLGR